MKSGDLIKNHLNTRKISIPALEKKTGLTNADIKNIIYNKSRNLDKISLIAKALNLPLSRLMPTVLQEPFCYQSYALAVHNVATNLQLMSAEVDKDIFDEYVAQMYNYILSNLGTKNEKEFFTYCEGMVRTAINSGAIPFRFKDHNNFILGTHSKKQT